MTYRKPSGRIEERFEKNDKKNQGIIKEAIGKNCRNNRKGKNKQYLAKNPGRTKEELEGIITGKDQKNNQGIVEEELGKTERLS